MMYTITRGPSKLVTQRRTGPTQQLDSKINDFKHKQTSWNMPDLPSPKIVFNRVNGKKYHQPAVVLSADSQQEESFSPAHEENVKFVSEGFLRTVNWSPPPFPRPHPHSCSDTDSHAWQEVGQGLEAPQKAVYYKETTPGPHMDSFVPIDLDEWWAQRFLANIDKLS